jgi:RNA polymerase sigma factor (sigma-70 family)
LVAKLTIEYIKKIFYLLNLCNLLQSSREHTLEKDTLHIENQSDASLIANWVDITQREKIFQLIVSKYKSRLYWHIRRLVLNHDDSDDVLQETFIKAWSSLYTWLYRIATNNALTHLAKRKKEQTRMTSFDENIVNQFAGNSNFDANKLEWKLQLAIASLPEKQRLVFNLRYYDEMPYEQISEVLETSVGGLKANYHHAAKKIEEYILNHAQ